VMVSPGCRDMDKSGGDQSTRQTAAMASLNVGSCLRYHSGVWTKRRRGVPYQVIGPHGDQREHPQQSRSGAEDGEIGPLALRLDTNVGTYLLKGCLHPPA
jgi:hypothetical protein